MKVRSLHLLVDCHQPKIVQKTTKLGAAPDPKNSADNQSAIDIANDMRWWNFLNSDIMVRWVMSEKKSCRRKPCRGTSWQVLKGKPDDEDDKDNPIFSATLDKQRRVYRQNVLPHKDSKSL